MKKIKIAVLTLICFFMMSGLANALCSTEEMSKLNTLAVNVKPSYEEAEGIMEPGTYVPPDGLTEEELKNYEEKYFYFKIYISNLTEDLYVVVTNDIDKEKKTYTYQDSENGVITIDWEDIFDITNFTITVYSSDKTGCPNTKLTTLYLTTPRYNEYYDYEVCNSNQEFYLCYKYLTVDKVEFVDFARLMESYQNGKIDKNGAGIVEEQPKGNGFINFIKENKGLAIGTIIVVIAVGGLVTVIIVKKQRSKKA